MSISTKCTNCNRKYKVKDELEGKRAKCQQCGTVFVIARAPTSQHQVFISYASPDKSVAEAMCTVLERDGLKCWMAPRDIVPGADYGSAIVGAINQSHGLVLVFSSHSNKSPQVRREIERAASKGIPIIPFRIENVPLNQAMEYYISVHHWMDATNPPFEQHLSSLSLKVKSLLAGHPQKPRVNDLEPAGLEDVKSQAYTAGFYGYLVIMAKRPDFMQVPEITWSHYEAACRRARVNSNLRAHLASILQLSSTECNPVFDAHVIPPFQFTSAGDVRLHVVLGALILQLSMGLELEAQLGEQYRQINNTDGLFVNAITFAHRAQVSQAIFDGLGKIHRSYATARDPASLFTCKRELDALFQPLLVVEKL